jgi:small subunit ribosomal protein S3
MTITSRNQISHYQEAKSNLQSLVKQTCQVGLGFTVMLLVTAGRPSAFGLSVTVGLGIAFVTWGEVRRLNSDNLSINEETQKENIKTYDNAGIADIRIERKADQIQLGIHTAKPDVVIGGGGAGIEQLHLGLQTALGGTRQIRINVIEVAKVDADARSIGEYVAQQLERRVPFRRVVRQAIKRAQRAEVKGIKIQFSGRLNGAEIASTEWVREGVPLHTLRDDIDYAYVTAKTTYGILGVKVWIFKGEIISGQDIQPVVAPAAQPHRKSSRREQLEDRSGE